VVIQDLRKRWATMPSVKLNNTLQEMWSATTDSSQQWSHCPLAPLYVLFMDIAGIRPLAAGFARCQIRPQLGDLPDLELTAQTVRGPIALSAERQGEGHHVRVSLPAEVEAEVVAPSDAKIPLPRLAAEPGLARYRLARGGSAEFFLPTR
jgi:hypothetical protein